MTQETIETIRFALEFLKGINSSIVVASKSNERVHQVCKDLQRDVSAIAEFEQYVNEVKNG